MIIQEIKQKIFIFGNKLKDENLVAADGVRKEFEIAKKQKVLLIPVGATGSMAKMFWRCRLKNFYPIGF